MMLGIVRKMATLAKCAQVLGGIVLWLMIEMSDSEHHLAARYRVRLVILTTAEFAAISCALETDVLAYLLPVVWISIFVLGLNRHAVASSARNRSAGPLRRARVSVAWW